MRAAPQNYNAYLKSRAWREKREVRMAEMMGSVYILVNKNIPGWIKVGRTQGIASQHARRMTRKTGVSEPFEVVYEVRCGRSEELEHDIHRELQEYRRPGQTFYAYPIDYEYPVEDAIWMLERLHFPHLSIDAAILLLERLHFDFKETSEPLRENNHPWNQKAKQLLLQLPADDVETEYNSMVPYNQVDENRLYVLQLMEWGLNTYTGRSPSEMPRDDSEWTESEWMMKWRDKQRRDGHYAFADLQIVEEQMRSFILDMTPKQIMLYLMVVPEEHPEEAIHGEMSVFEETSDPSTGAIFLLHTVCDITKIASASLYWTQYWWTTWW